MKIQKNSMDSRTINLYDLTEGNLYFPLFQRGYVWPAERAEKLYENILDAAIENASLKKRDKNFYYLTPIYFYECETQPYITDGQQRLITLFVLFRCINDYIKENGITNVKPLDEFHIEYKSNDFQKKWRRFSEKRVYSTKKYVVAYKVAKAFVEENTEYLKDLRDFLKNNILTTTINCGSPDAAYEIFNLLNAGSEPMKKEDIIMTSMNQYSELYNVPLNKNANMDDIIALMEDYCQLTIKANQSDRINNFSVMSFMNKEVVQTREQFQRFAEFLDKVVAYKNNTLYKILSYSQRPKLRSLFCTMVLKDIDMEHGEDAAPYVDKIFEPMLQLNLAWKMNGVKGTQPSLLFKRIREAINDEKKPDEILEIICAHINNNPKDCTIVTKKAIECLADAKIFGSSNIFKSLYLYDVFRSNKSAYIDATKVELEHIYPQVPEGEWAANRYPTNDEAKDKLCKRPGNYMLIPGSLNSKIKNKFIAHKKEAYDKIIETNKILSSSNLNCVDFDKFLRGDSAEEYMKERESLLINTLKEKYICGNLIFIDQEN